jgi:hypothetical protein
MSHMSLKSLILVFQCVLLNIPIADYFYESACKSSDLKVGYLQFGELKIIEIPNFPPFFLWHASFCTIFLARTPHFAMSPQANAWALAIGYWTDMRKAKGDQLVGETHGVLLCFLCLW